MNFGALVDTAVEAVVAAAAAAAAVATLTTAVGRDVSMILRTRDLRTQAKTCAIPMECITDLAVVIALKMRRSVGRVLVVLVRLPARGNLLLHELRHEVAAQLHRAVEGVVEAPVIRRPREEAEVLATPPHRDVVGVLATPPHRDVVGVLATPLRQGGVEVLAIRYHLGEVADHLRHGIVIETKHRKGNKFVFSDGTARREENRFHHTEEALQAVCAVVRAALGAFEAR